ncbi:hypothetical protein KPH14_004258 [Odynerus spinipes]|uniref:receptor protein-tyrosine kinase n=1 Tax=Odynerus spinipes TaxID=1348599 RepID=A0AAD9RYN3_9HYME|nr:hypothetical protein KPH14_004258 [Odynerus spinipes]
MPAATREMKLPTIFFLILFGSGFCRESIKMMPDESEIIINAGEPLELECSGSDKIYFFYPPNNAGQLQKATTSEPVIKEDNVNVAYRYVFSRPHTVPGDTGWYGCSYYNVTTSPEVEDPAVKWTYVYVTSPNSSFVEENAMETVKLLTGHTATIPCRPTSPDLKVTMYDENSEKEVPIGGRISYDPRFGFRISRVKLSDGTFFNCVINRNGEEYYANYHLLVLRNLTLDNPRIFNDTLKHVILGQTLRVNCSIDLESDTTYVFEWKTPHKNPRITTHSYTIHKGLNSQQVISELVIEDVRSEDEGEYECNITTFFNTKATKTYLKMHDPDVKYINLTPQDPKKYYQQHYGGKIQWVVYVDAYPEPQLKWIDPRGKVISGDSPDLDRPKYVVNKTQSSILLTINNLDMMDMGVYTLEATNAGGMEYLNLTLDVLTKPVPILASINAYYAPGQTVEFQCSVTAFPKPDITWNFIGLPNYPSPANAIRFELMEVRNETKQNVFHSVAEMIIEMSGNINCTACNSQGCDYAVDNILVSDGVGAFGIIEPKGKVAEGDNIEIICAASVYNYTNSLTWSNDTMKDLGDFEEYLANNEHMSVEQTQTPFTYRSILKINNVRKEDAELYVCTANTTDGGREDIAYKLDVYDQKPPMFKETNLNGTELNIDLGKEGHKTIVLKCFVDGMPEPVVTWHKDGVMLTKNDQYSFLHNDQELHITYLLENNNGKYSCRAANRLKAIEAFVNITIKGKEISKGLIAMIAILLAVVVILVIYFTIKVRREKILRKELLETGLMHFEEGALECLNPDLTVDDQAELLPYDKKWEFPRERLKLGKQLGSGAFGVVMKAEAQGICEDEAVTTVAVKMVRRTTDPTYVRALASELKIMVHLGKHLNVVNLLGACTKNISKRELLVIVEYCRFGNLHNYLLRHRSDFINQIDPTNGKFDPMIGIDLLTRTTSISSNNSISANSETETMPYSSRINSDSQDVTMSPDGCILSNNSSQPGWRSNYRGDYKDQNLKPICTQDLLSWAFQVARGMEYLSQRKVLHGDLAARNILLAEDNIVKICDFGLAKTMYKDDNYKKKGDGPLPIKWMAIESIRDRIFSTQSDIWSFGIVLWEFFTLAETPYPGMEAEKQYQKLIEGYRMEQPAYATSDVYNIMLQCWKAKPTLRPSFTELVDSIGDLLEDNVKAHYISLNAPYIDMNTMILEGKNDYLTMMSAPDHAALSSPNYYINSPTSENAAESAYLCMSPTNPGDESGIFSPRPNPEKSRFEFPSVTSDSEDAVELSPMLKNEEDPYLKPINVHERRAEFARQRQATKNRAIDQGNDRDSGYCNAPRNIHLIDLNEKRKDVDNRQEDQDRTDSLSKKKEYAPAIISTQDNYVNMPKQKSDLRKDMPDSFSNPSYIMMGNSEANQTIV